LKNGRASTTPQSWSVPVFGSAVVLRTMQTELMVINKSTRLD
jgi:hypothetical protein